MKEIIRIRLRHEFPLLVFLHEILVTLLLRESNGILFGLEIDVSRIRDIPRRLPSYQIILPTVSFAQDFPIHSPHVPMPVARLGRCFGWPIDAVKIEGQSGFRTRLLSS